MICINELDRGGAEKALVNISIGLRDLGWPVTVVSLRDRGPLAASLEEAEIPTHALGCGGMTDIRVLGRLTGLLRTLKPQILLTFLHQAGFWGRLAARRAGIPITVCGVRVADRRSWVRWSDRLTSGRVTHYIAVSRNVAQTHAQLCGLLPEQISSIPNGIDCPEQQPQPERPRPAKVLFLGRLTAQKDPANLLRAWQDLPEEIRSATELHFVGDGDLSEAIRSAVPNALRSQVLFHGHQADAVPYLSEATILVLPSSWEGMPNAVLEAMATGLPVIATQVDGTEELIPDDRFGWLVPPRDTAQLTAAMVEALSSPEDRHSRAAAALERVRSEFTWERVVQQYDQRLLQLLASRQDTKSSQHPETGRREHHSD